MLWVGAGSVCWENGSAGSCSSLGLRALCGQAGWRAPSHIVLLTHERMFGFGSMLGLGNAVAVERIAVKNLTLQVVCCMMLVSLLTSILFPPWEKGSDNLCFLEPLCRLNDLIPIKCRVPHCLA